MKHHLCFVTSDNHALNVVKKAFLPLGIEVDHVEPHILVAGQLERSAKVTVVDLEAFDRLPQDVWDNLKASLEHTLCVPLTAQVAGTVYRSWVWCAAENAHQTTHRSTVALAGLSMRRAN